MAEVEIPIFIIGRDGDKKPITAWARTADDELVCHPVFESWPGDGAWTITHRKTGLRVNPSRTYNKDDALALIDVLAGLTDWSAITGEFASGSPLEREVNRVYEQFVPSAPPAPLLDPVSPP